MANVFVSQNNDLPYKYFILHFYSLIVPGLNTIVFNRDVKNILTILFSDNQKLLVRLNVI